MSLHPNYSNRSTWESDPEESTLEVNFEKPLKTDTDETCYFGNCKEKAVKMIEIADMVYKWKKKVYLCADHDDAENAFKIVEEDGEGI